MFEIFKNKKGFVITNNNELVLKYNYGIRGGHWKASGYFNEIGYSIIKNNDEILENDLKFGTVNATHYTPVLMDAYIANDKLFAKVIRKTRKWAHTYHWKIERM